MRKERQVMFGFVVMLFFLLAGIVGNVSAAAVVENQLQLEVQLLEKVNQLNLTNGQIEQILPILKKVDSILDTTKAECDKLLAEQKELLVQRKTDEADAVETRLQVVREKAMLEVKQTLLDLQVIFTDEQKAMLKKKLAVGGPVGMGMMMPGQGQQMQQGRVIIGKYNPPAVGNIKPKEKDLNYTDVKDRKEQVGDGASGRLPEDVLKILLEKQQKRIAELEKELETATGTEKENLKKRIAEMKAKTAELKETEEIVVIGKVEFPQQEMGRGRMTAPGQMKKWVECGNMGMMMQRMKQHRDLTHNSVMLKTLIKVLEEMVAAN